MKLGDGRIARWWVPAILVLGLGIFVPCLVNALRWIDRPFPGFLVLHNCVVVSIGRTEWIPAPRRSAQWTRVVALDSRPVATGREVQEYAEAAGSGKSIAYTFRRGTELFRLQLEVRPFRAPDFVELFAPLLVVGLVLVLAGAVLLLLRSHAPEVRALCMVCLSFGMMLITGPDEYYPYRFTSLFFLSLCLVPPAILQFALSYPQPSRLLRRGTAFYAVLYLPFVALGLGLIWSASEPSIFLPLLYTVYFFTANAVLMGVGGTILAMMGGVRPRTSLVLVLVAAIGSAVPLAILVSYPLLQRPISVAWLVGPLLLMPAFIGTALLRFPVTTAPGAEGAA